MIDAIVWHAGGLELVIDLGPTYPSLRYIGLPGSVPDAAPGALPLAQVRLAGEGNAVATSERLMGSALSERLRYVSHQQYRVATKSSLVIKMKDDTTQVLVTSRFESWDGIPVVRSETSLRNDGPGVVHVQLVSSLSIGAMTGGANWPNDTVSFAHNTWFREAMWQRRQLCDVGIDDMGLLQWGYSGSRASFAITGRGSWSSGGHLPMGMLTSHGRDRTLLWQIENNGPWRWEVGDYHESTYLIASGPTDQAHQWTKALKPGEVFSSVPAAIAVTQDEDSAFAAMTDYRRNIRRPHPDHENLPIIFNDFMNCLMGDPSTEKLMPVIDAAARLGAEYFCIDAGWYAEDGDWWDSVGEWMPSRSRFPGGLQSVIDHIRCAGMVPGLWLEPEVVGVRSPVASSLPEAAFFSRGGERIVEAGRYQLDFRHPAVLAHLDAVIGRLVEEYGVGYLKFDYNIDVTQGTDVDADSPGDGQLEHNRAYLAWIVRLLETYPTLVIENCSSGGQRMDYAMLAIHQVQSTSDNQDPSYYSAVSAAAPTAVTPEQGAVWAYPQPDWSDERNALTMVNSLLGRVHLSGRVDLLDDKQTQLVAEAIDVYRSIRDGLRSGHAFWPTGLPGWHDDILTLGMLTPAGTYLAVWRRNGSRTLAVPLDAKFVSLNLACIYPTTLPTSIDWDDEAGLLTIGMPDEPSARLIRLA